MVAHGVRSSGLFAIAYYPYLTFHSRNLFLIKSQLIFSGTFVLIWFLLCMRNMGGPFTLNLIAEILTIIGMINYNYISLFLIGITSFLTVIFCLILYILMAHGQTPNKEFEKSPLPVSGVGMGIHHACYSFALTIILHVVI